MSEVDRSALAECEAIIERGFQTFHEVGRALLKIRDEELFREHNYRSFHQYCRERWSGSVQSAFHLIDAAQVVDNLSSCDEKPQQEYQIRPLARLEPDQQREAWNIAVEQSKSGQPSYREVKDVVRAHFPPEPTQAEVEAERRAREAEKRAEQLLQERREAEERAEALLRERDEVQFRRYMRFRKLIEAVQCVAEFHMESVADVWDGISNARGGEDFMENMEKAQRCLTRLKSEHPNAVRKPAVILSKQK